MPEEIDCGYRRNPLQNPDKLGPPPHRRALSLCDFYNTVMRELHCRDRPEDMKALQHIPVKFKSGAPVQAVVVAEHDGQPAFLRMCQKGINAAGIDKNRIEHFVGAVRIQEISFPVIRPTIDFSRT